LKIVISFKYLDVIFTTGGSFNATYDSLHKSLFTLKSYLIRFPNMTDMHKLDLFDKLIEPILNYSCEIWGVNDAVKLENTHIHFRKSILGVRSQTNNNFVYVE